MIARASGATSANCGSSKSSASRKPASCARLAGIKRISRRAMSAPSSGSSKVHAVEQQEIIDEALVEERQLSEAFG